MPEQPERLSDHVRQDVRERMAGQDPQGSAPISQRALARAAGVTQSTLSRFLSGRQIGTDDLDRIVDYLDPALPPGTIAGGAKPSAGA